jgi:hypothetical protein
MESFAKFMDALPPLKSKKNPGLACLLGLLFGGVGLGIYFWSIVDFVIPIGISILALVALGNIGFWGGVVVAGLWGFFRAVNSNARLESETRVV